MKERYSPACEIRSRLGPGKGTNRAEDIDRELDITCSFCRTVATQARYIIAGPFVYICDRCILEASGALLEEQSGSAVPFSSPSGPDEECSFCSQHREKVWKLLSRSGHNVCSECLEVCLFILRDQGLADAATAEQMARVAAQNRLSEKTERSFWKRFFHA